MTERRTSIRFGSRTWPSLTDAGRLVLVGAIVFWWGGFVVPRLVSLAFPELLSSWSIPWHMNPELEGSLANVVSAASFLAVSLVATTHVVVAHRRSAGRVVVGGWAVVAGGAVLSGVDEVLDYHDGILSALKQLVFRAVDSNTSIILLTSLLVAFALALWGFSRQGLPAPPVRILFNLGVAVWLFAAVRDFVYPFLYQYRIESLASMVEETLEFGGALLVGLSAVAALELREPVVSTARRLSLTRVVQLAAGAAIAVAMLGGWYVAFAFQAPVVDTRAYTHVGSFDVSLGHSEAVVQEFRMPAVPIARLDLRLAVSNLNGRAGAAVWRIVDVGDQSGRILRAGRLAVPAGEHSKWRRIRFPPLSQPEGRPLVVLVRSDAGPGANLLAGANKTQRNHAGRLWINGEQAWPDQNLAIVAHSAPEPTRSKLEAIWIFLTSEWHWPLLFVDVSLSLVILTMIPSVLVAGALRPAFWGPS